MVGACLEAPSGKINQATTQAPTLFVKALRRWLVLLVSFHNNTTALALKSVEMTLTLDLSLGPRNSSYQWVNPKPLLRTGLHHCYTWLLYSSMLLFHFYPLFSALVLFIAR